MGNKTFDLIYVGLEIYLALVCVDIETDLAFVWAARLISTKYSVQALSV